jgi:hypothetical protein
MIKYGPYKLTADEYNRQIFCNGKPGNPSIYHNWIDLDDGCREKCTKCGMVRWIVRWDIAKRLKERKND